jgi:hypothetical protein
MQSHLNVGTGGNNAYPSASLFGQAITTYKNLGVKIHVTELDATIEGGNESYFSAQATYYKDIMNEILTKGGSDVEAVVIWGIQDNQSWRSDRKPLLFDASGNKKAAYNELVKLIPESEWGKPTPSSSSAAPSSSSRPSSSSTVASSSSRPNNSSSSNAVTGPQECGEYKTSFCGGLAYASVPSNSTTMPATGECLYIGDFEVIQPFLNSTVAINGVENVCGDTWEGENGEGGCGYNERPATKDGGYYVYVKAGTINSYQDNGWQGIVAKAKPSCSTPIASPSPLAASHSPTYYSLKGEPLGSAKPQKAGIYIVKQGYSVKKIAVR